MGKAKTKKQIAMDQKYHGLLEITGDSDFRSDYVRCLCQCGNTCDLNVYNIISGLKGDCGCVKGSVFNTVSNIKVFGHLTVLRKSKEVGKALCLCSCGVEKDISIYGLLIGDYKTCGCGYGKVTSKMKCLDIKYFGYLSVTGESSDPQKVSCLCSCGNTKDVVVSSLLHGYTRSCGCLLKESFHERVEAAGKRLIGYRNKSTQGDWFEVIKYVNCDLVYIRFDCNGYEINTSAGNIRKGEVRNVLRPSVCGVGYLGEGSYTSEHKAYTHWSHMMARCYTTGNYNHTYKDAEVSEEWHNYQSFAKWFHDNWVGNLDVALDKDLLIKGNKLYSESTCCLVPENLNNFPCNSGTIRGELPLGLTRSDGKIMAQVYFYGKHETIGLFTEVESAFLAYKERKEEIAKLYAEKYYSQGLIDKRLKNALYNYTVDRDD